MDPFIASCASCGGPFLAQRRAARYCGAACRQRARRSRGQGVIAPLPGRQAEPAPLTYAKQFVAAVKACLVAAGRQDEPLSLLALSLAEDAVNERHPAAARKQFTAEFRATYAEAMRGVRAPTTIDELRARRRGTR